MSTSSTFVATDGDGYELTMGRWSRRLAQPFLDFIGPGCTGRVLDVGCGTGSLAFALAQIRDPRAADALMVAAKDRDAEVRAQAFFGLARLGDPRAKDLAITGLKDQSPEVRRAAAMALANLADHDE